MTTKAPETIWAVYGRVYERQPETDFLGTEYVRADLHAAVVAERDALKSTVRHILDYLAEPAEDTLSGMRHDLRFIANTCRAALAKQEPKE